MRCSATPLSFVCFAFMQIGTATAQIVDYPGAQELGAAVVPGEELRALVSGATVRYQIQTTATRGISFATDGTMTGETDGRKAVGGLTSPSSSTGTWRIDDQGRLCVAQKWRRNAESWCTIVLKIGERYLVPLSPPGPSGKASELTVSR